MTLNLKNALACLMVVAGFWMMGTRAEAVTVLFTDSEQLNLTNRNILSAVNFYDGNASGGTAQQVTGTIQGVSFLNLDHATQTTAGALTVDLPFADDGRTQSGASITGTGPDQARAVELANALTYWNSSTVGSLSYDFGISNANRNVQVQLVGGDSGWDGEMDVRISGISQGTMLGDTNGNTADLLTFDTTLGPAGELQLDIDVINGNFYALAGAIVTSAIPVPIPEPSSFVLMLGGLCGLMARRRKHTNQTRTRLGSGQ